MKKSTSRSTPQPVAPFRDELPIPCSCPTKAEFLAELERRITNLHMEFHESCQFARGRTGLVDFAFLAWAFPYVTDFELLGFMRLIDEVGQSQKCAPCHAKILAFSEIYAARRFQGKSRDYRRKYETYHADLTRLPFHRGRDFRAEVREAVEKFKPDLTPYISWRSGGQSGR